MSYFIVSRCVPYFKVCVSVYRCKLHIVCFLVYAGDHYHIASGAFDIIHVTAVYTKQQYVDISVNVHQRKIIIFRSRLMHLINYSAEIAVYSYTTYQQRQYHDCTCQNGNSLPVFQALYPLLEASFFPCFFFCSAHCSKIPLFFFFFA